jgi:hypothetical protein
MRGNEMSYDLDGRRKSDNRAKINNMTGGSDAGRDFARCPSCIDQPRLQIQKDANGNRIGVCVKSCGQTFQLDQVRNEETGGKHYVAKYPAITKSFIASQGDKNKQRKQIGSINDELDADTLKDLSDMGVNVS